MHAVRQTNRQTHGYRGIISVSHNFQICRSLFKENTSISLFKLKWKCLIIAKRRYHNTYNPPNFFYIYFTKWASRELLIYLVNMLILWNKPFSGNLIYVGRWSTNLSSQFAILYELDVYTDIAFYGVFATPSVPCKLRLMCDIVYLQISLIYVSFSPA